MDLSIRRRLLLSFPFRQTGLRVDGTKTYDGVRGRRCEQRTHVTRPAREARPEERVFHGYRAEPETAAAAAASRWPSPHRVFPTGRFSVRFYVFRRSHDGFRSARGSAIGGGGQPEKNRLSRRTCRNATTYYPKNNKNRPVYGTSVCACQGRL